MTRTTTRLISQATQAPDMVWLRLAIDRTGLSNQFDTVRHNFTSPIAITLPEPSDVAVQGQPAVGWISALDVRVAAHGQGLELWALVRWLPSTQPRPDWAAITIEPNSIDPRSGEPRGPKLAAVQLVEPPATFTRATARPTEKANPMNQTQLILSKFATHRATAPNDAVALERAALEVVDGAKELSREQLYENHVHPALAELGRSKLVAASRAGALRQSLPTLASAGRATSARPRPQSSALPVLDVSSQPGRNPTEKLVLHVKASRPELSHDAAFVEAMRLKEGHRIVA